MTYFKAHLTGNFICTVPDEQLGGSLGCQASGPVFRVETAWVCPDCLQKREVLEHLDQLFADKKT